MDGSGGARLGRGWNGNRGRAAQRLAKSRASQRLRFSSSARAPVNVRSQDRREIKRGWKVFFGLLTWLVVMYLIYTFWPD